LFSCSVAVSAWLYILATSTFPVKSCDDIFVPPKNVEVDDILKTNPVAVPHATAFT